MTIAAPSLFISLSGIARLAHVQRPVVSVWRTRAASSESPFPPPVADDRGSEVFDARQVAEWLAQTGRGNNPHVLADAPAYARFDATGRGDEESFHALTALVAVRAAGAPIGALDRDQLLDLADELDPDDVCVAGEVDGLGDDVVSMARFVEVLVDGAYSASAAFESLLGDRFRDGRRALTRTALGAEASELVNELAVELARSNPFADPEHPLFVDPTGACGDLLVGVLRSVAEGVDVGVMTAESGGFAGRLLRRRLLAHGMPHAPLTVSATGEFAAEGALVHVAQFPTPDRPTMTAGQILASIENIALQMDDAQRGVVLAPAAILIDGDLSPDAEAIRSEILRSGRLRAVVRLPRGLVIGNPRQALALWVFGPAHAAVSLADKWTLVADLIEEPLVPATRSDLVSDLAAAMGDESFIRAHAFRFARRLPTSVILAGSGSLIAAEKPVAMVPVEAAAARRASAGLPAQLDAVIAGLGDGAPVTVRHVTVAASPRFLPQAALGSLASARHVRCLPGARIRHDDIGTAAGYPVIGVDELTGASLVGSRTIDRLLLEAAYPAARLTAPGDVVFCVSPQPRAWVDAAGFSVVVYPARILRIDTSDPAGLVPEVLAADIERHTSRDWKRWVARRIVPTERAGLVDVLANVSSERAALAERMRRLDELANVLVDGVAVGALTTAGSDAEILALSKGTM
ncbi:hypothetical protein FB562_0206 [Homoserinimonas aerilata]|uniref:N-6 DNA methylase n=1 Tax=Homoserinimonas aerilata TaxID=1162970 RepID=A0A542YGC9_9MICO|nr:hypothetical protein [Homoserinimonas aerilata]TQL47158.1 hypothetical protein FB562_0206 [Homoserinimonas aerilata]